MDEEKARLGRQKGGKSVNKRGKMPPHWKEGLSVYCHSDRPEPAKLKGANFYAEMKSKAHNTLGGEKGRRGAEKGGLRCV